MSKVGTKLAGLRWSTVVEGATLAEVEAQATEAWLDFAGPEYADRLLTLEVDAEAVSRDGLGNLRVVTYSGSAHMSIR